MVRTRTTKHEWARRVEAWRASGESATEFAARHGWNARTLTWWSSHGLRTSAESGAQRSVGTAFVEVVAATKPKTRSERIEIVLRNGRRLRVRDAQSLDALCELARALEA